MTSSAVQRINCNLIAPGFDRAATAAPLGRIFNIQRFSLNDGQGIRTLVFFKGCPHTCPWCANPESMSGKFHLVRRKAKCLHCQPCLNDAQECPSGAMELIGQSMTLDALLLQILKDEVFYRSSGGGVTLSGGEVLMQAEFAGQLLQRLQALGINTAIETAGDAPLASVLALAEHCDQVLFDLKIMNTNAAKRLLNINQPRVLANFTMLAQRGIKLLPRLPLIPGYTLDQENMAQVLAFLAPFGLSEIHLLPFHQYGEAKYELLGREYTLRNVAPPSEQEIAPLQAMAQQAGFRVTMGG
ncbi:[formate-C-acetyltransferase]-activating enzyme [Serratia proteamaculans]|uniref:[formate-C-acetyltransferase]-activating enzyme n=1 Tax=Serratia proteamaculans TaxID=28151 RepID=A0A7U0NAQ1_SERPR|nr:[formate-C-acetyltransferase]-activating enzyme [Serratia proteamaculans]MBO1503629.1 [formate-C-acetyltransferase]-activating enzyme [Serratia proteamaculans]MDW5512227.1 [formate-C-acetyltransferase]-activating enzyme [Serratia proteamaculans]QQX55656.1 [formate-C-acetyltransferase]-activating enzyme [Serratia proteamaculans]